LIVVVVVVEELELESVGGFFGTSALQLLGAAGRHFLCTGYLHTEKGE